MSNQIGDIGEVPKYVFVCNMLQRKKRSIPKNEIFQNVRRFWDSC
jgi:hypothetical protein